MRSWGRGPVIAYIKVHRLEIKSSVKMLRGIKVAIFVSAHVKGKNVSGISLTLYTLCLIVNYC